jgi:hypothetical protein
VDLYPLPGSLPPDPVDTGWAQAIHRGPRTVAEVLAAASQAMDAEDMRERMARDPLRWVRTHRPRRTRRTLLARLLDRHH